MDDPTVSGRLIGSWSIISELICQVRTIFVICVWQSLLFCVLVHVCILSDWYPDNTHLAPNFQTLKSIFGSPVHPMNLKLKITLKLGSKSTKLHGNGVLVSRSRNLFFQKWCLKSLIFDHFEVRFGVDPMVRIDSKPKFPLVPTYNYSRFQGIYPTPNSLGDLMLQKFLASDPSNARNILIWLQAV